MVEPAWLTIARGELGTAEVEGPKSNSRIVEYAKVAAGIAAPDSDAWCATFVGFCLEKDGLAASKSSGQRNARSYLDAPGIISIEQGVLGCIVVFWRVSPKSWQGHVGFFIREDKTHVWVLGGNQSNKVSIAKYPKDQVLGYRWIAGIPLPAAPPSPEAELRKIQARLKELGYHEVGNVDGLWGNRTRDAIRAFIVDWNERTPGSDNDLPAGGTTRAALVTDKLIVALSKAYPRTISPLRETVESKNIGEFAAIKETKKASWIGWLMGFFGVSAGAEQMGASALLDKAEGVSSIVTRTQAVIEPLVPLWPVLVIAAGVGVVIWMRKVRDEERVSVRMGETNGEIEP